MNAVAAPPSPFKGLAPFGDSDVDALLFFGRARDTEEIAANLEASRLTVLFGPSGVGKSSILRAGVAHRLRQEPDTAVAVVDNWAADAAAAVRDALRAKPADGDLYLILDQFEEYFLYHQDDEQLPALLADVVDERGLRVNVLIGIREDALARLDTFTRPIPNLLANRLRLDRLDREAARTAIVGPVARYNELAGETVEVEPELVEAVLDQVTPGRVDLGRTGRGAVDGSPDGGVEAPYLQLVLERLWEAERAAGSSRLRLETLERLGGAARIVHDHLDHAMADLTPGEREAAAAMYNHLVTPSGMKIGHRVGDLAGYASVGEAEAATILRKLARERIVRGTSDDGPAATRYEIFHDVLADAVLAWRARHEEARALGAAEASRRRAHRVAAAAVAALVIVAGVAVYALLERSHARSQARRAHAEELAARALTELETDPRAALRLAYDAARQRPGRREEEVLRRALTTDRLRATLRGAHAAVTTALFSPSGREILAASADGRARLYRRGSSKPTHVFRHGDGVTTASFSRDGKLIATGGADGTVKLWLRTSEQPLRELAAGGSVRAATFVAGGRLVTASIRGDIRVWRTRDAHLVHAIKAAAPHGLRTLVVDPNARYAAAVTFDRFVRVYSLATGRLVRTIRHEGFAGGAAFSPDGRLLVTTGYDGSVRIWRVGTWSLFRRLLGGQRQIPSIAFSPDGSRVAAVSADASVRIWDVSTGTQLGVGFHRNPATSIAFNRAGTAIVSTSIDGTARVWLATPEASARPVSLLAGHRGPVVAAAFSPDGRAVVTAGADATSRIWDPASEPDFRIVNRRRAALTALAVRDDGRRLAVGRSDGIVETRTADARRVLRTERLRSRVTAVAFGRTGATAVSAPASAVAYAADGEQKAVGDGLTIRVSSRRGDRATLLRGTRGVVLDLAFRPGGDELAAALDNGDVEIWDLRRGRRRLTLGRHSTPVGAVSYSPDGRVIASVGGHEVWLWNAETGRIERKLEGPNARDVQFSRDGRWFVTAGPTTVGLWDGQRPASEGLLRAAVARPFSGAAFSGTDGRLIVAASADGTLQTYRCDLCGGIDDLLALAKRRLAER